MEAALERLQTAISTVSAQLSDKIDRLTARVDQQQQQQQHMGTGLDSVTRTAEAMRVTG